MRADNVSRMDVVDREMLRVSRVLLVALVAGSAVLAVVHGGYFPTEWGAAASAMLLLLVGLVGAPAVLRSPSRN